MIFDAVGSARSDNPIGSISRHLECAEIAAGNERTASLLKLPGLAAWVHSVPVGPVDAGGDVHYVSLCPSCIVSRIALADVSGHGQAVAALGVKLRELMQRHLRELAQVGLMQELNQAVREELGDVHYATMVAVGWHIRRGFLVMTNAGHPPPLWYRASRQEWSWLQARRTSERDRPTGIPLGLLDDIDYDRTVVKLQLGDLVVLYSDGASEASKRRRVKWSRSRTTRARRLTVTPGRPRGRHCNWRTSTGTRCGPTTTFRFSSGEPGIEATEIPSIADGGSVLRGLRVRFPQEIHSHSSEQSLYFDDSGLLRRQDYQVDVAGRGRAAHLISDYVDMQGLLFPTRRRVFMRSADGTLQLDKMPVSIDLSDFELS